MITLKFTPYRSKPVDVPQIWGIYLPYNEWRMIQIQLMAIEIWWKLHDITKQFIALKHEQKV